MSPRRPRRLDSDRAVTEPGSVTAPRTMSKMRIAVAAGVDERRRCRRANATCPEHGHGTGRVAAEVLAVGPLETREVGVVGVARAIWTEQQRVGHTHGDDRRVRLGGSLPRGSLERHGDVDTAITAFEELDEELRQLRWRSHGCGRTTRSSLRHRRVGRQSCETQAPTTCRCRCR